MGANSDYTYKMWSEKDYMPLIRKHNLLHQYHSRTNMTQKSDIARWVILLEYGGLYGDVDIEPLFEDGIIPTFTEEIILMRLPIGIFSSFTLQNAFIGVKKNNILANVMVKRMRELLDPAHDTPNGSWNYIASTTGSLLIKSIIENLPRSVVDSILWLDDPLVTFHYGDGYCLSSSPEETRYFCVHQTFGKDDCNSMCRAARAYSLVPGWRSWVVFATIIIPLNQA